MDQDRIEAREARDRFEERVDKDRVDSKDAQDRFEIRVGRERLEARNAQDRIQVERRGARRDMADLEAQLDQARRLESLGQLRRRSTRFQQPPRGNPQLRNVRRRGTRRGHRVRLVTALRDGPQ